MILLKKGVTAVACSHLCVRVHTCECDSVYRYCYVWLHCISWIITVRSLRPRLSLNGQSQVKLGYRRPRAEQPGHQESKIKQQPFLPPKIDHHRQPETRLMLRKKLAKDFQWISILYVSSWPPRPVQSSEQQIKERACNVIFNFVDQTKEDVLEVITWPLRAKSMVLLLGTTRPHWISLDLRWCGGTSARWWVGLSSPAHLRLTLPQ